MTEELRFPEYHAGSVKFTGPGLGMVGMVAGFAALARSGAPLPVLLGVPALAIAVLGLLYLASRRTATITGPDHIKVQGVFAPRFVAWSDIQAIDIESNPVAMVETNTPTELAVVYDRQGRKIVLPHLNAKSVALFHDEVRALRELWERLRGADWAPAPEATATIARSRTRAERTNSWFLSWMIALAAAMGSLVLTAVIVVALVLTGVTDDAEGPVALLVSPVMILVVPVVVGLAVLTTSVMRRGRRP